MGDFLVYLITYDIKTQNPKILETLKSFGESRRIHGTSLFVDTELSTSQMEGKIKPLLDIFDSILIIKVDCEYSGKLDDETFTWFLKHYKDHLKISKR